MQFEQVSAAAEVKGKCRVCERRGKRTLTVTHTVNQYNLTDKGAPKTRAEVKADVDRELAAKVAAGFVHSRCE